MGIECRCMAEVAPLGTTLAFAFAIAQPVVSSKKSSAGSNASCTSHSTALQRQLTGSKFLDKAPHGLVNTRRLSGLRKEVQVAKEWQGHWSRRTVAKLGQDLLDDEIDDDPERRVGAVALGKGRDL